MTDGAASGEGGLESVDRLISDEPVGPMPCPECGSDLTTKEMFTDPLPGGGERYRMVYRCANGHESFTEAYGFDRGQAPFTEIVFEKTDADQEGLE